MSKQDIYIAIDNISELIIDLSQRIWSHPEVGYSEHYAVKESIEAMKNAGFDIHMVNGMETAFYAEYGSGKPIIGILGEHDALPNLSQEVSAIRTPIREGGPGHGCGHNLLGAGAIGASIAIKEVIKREGIQGTIRYYGCPAEELLSGKVWMSVKGVFDDLDLCLSWHPMNGNIPMGGSKSGVALISEEYFFKGVSAHASAWPELGRSAYDAMELMNVGANYLREHICDGTRIHYAPTGKNFVPNIVPGEASVIYFVRAHEKEIAYDILDRVTKCAEGAATMTGTTVTHKLRTDCYNSIGSETLGQLLRKNMLELGEPVFDEKDEKFAEELVNSCRVNFERMKTGVNLPDGKYMDCSISPVRKGSQSPLVGSSDVGDVSQKVPTGVFLATCAPVGVLTHTWQGTASFGSSIGQKGMIYASKVLAACAYDAFTDGGKIIQEANEELRSYHISYTTRFPKDYKLD